MHLSIETPGSDDVSCFRVGGFRKGTPSDDLERPAVAPEKFVRQTTIKQEPTDARLTILISTRPQILRKMV